MIVSCAIPTDFVISASAPVKNFWATYPKGSKASHTRSQRLQRAFDASFAFIRAMSSSSLITPYEPVM